MITGTPAITYSTTAGTISGTVTLTRFCGLAGNDTLIGNQYDQLHGGVGDDLYLTVASGGIVELDGEGYDTVHMLRSTNYSLQAGVSIEAVVIVDASSHQPDQSYR